MFPSVNIRIMNISIGLNSKRELITAAVITDKQQIIERHIQFPKCLRFSKFQISALNF